MKEEIINELLEKLKQCDDYHNRCDFLMEHDEITYMLDYITNLQKENKELKERINKAIDKIEMEQIRRYLLIPEEEVLKILKGDSNE